MLNMLNVYFIRFYFFIKKNFFLIIILGCLLFKEYSFCVPSPTGSISMDTFELLYDLEKFKGMPLETVAQITDFKTQFEADMIQINSELNEPMTREQGDKIITLLEKILQEKKQLTLVQNVTRQVIMESISALINILTKALGR